MVFNHVYLLLFLDSCRLVYVQTVAIETRSMWPCGAYPDMAGEKRYFLGVSLRRWV